MNPFGKRARALAARLAPSGAAGAGGEGAQPSSAHRPARPLAFLRKRRWWGGRKPRLKTTLLGLLVPSVLGLLIFDSWSDYLTLHRTTDEAYDRALLGPALALSNSAVPTEDGGVRLDVPQLALAMLESAPGQRVYYRVTVVDVPSTPTFTSPTDPWPRLPVFNVAASITTEVAGMRDLPLPRVWPTGIEPVFYNTEYRNDPVRVVALSRPLDRRNLWGPQLLIQVGESTGWRLAQQAEAWRDKLSRNLIIIVVMVGLLLFGVYRALRPLNRLRAEVRTRAAADLNPLDASKVPQEIVPLVQAVNHHVQRLRDVLDAQSQFLADASHQLRTPLAIMRTQAEYALREPGTPRTRNSLKAILAQLERSGRLTSQLLALAHARHARQEEEPSGFDLGDLACDVTLEHLPLAHAKRQDLGWDDGEASRLPLPVVGFEATLREALSNLIHNAISYTPVGGTITVAARQRHGRAVVTVRDTGPGIPAALRQQAFARFRRGDGQAGDGAGLGLAIAREFVVLNGGSIHLSDGDPNASGGAGLCVTVSLPLAPSA